MAKVGHQGTKEEENPKKEKRQIISGVGAPSQTPEERKTEGMKSHHTRTLTESTQVSALSVTLNPGLQNYQEPFFGQYSCCSKHIGYN